MKLIQDELAQDFLKRARQFALAQGEVETAKKVDNFLDIHLSHCQGDPRPADNTDFSILATFGFSFDTSDFKLIVGRDEDCEPQFFGDE